jgi:hypothetical protein
MGARVTWRQFCDVKKKGSGSDWVINEPFLHFEKGTDVYDVWHWFESKFHISVGKDLLGL